MTDAVSTPKKALLLLEDMQDAVAMGNLELGDKWLKRINAVLAEYHENIQRSERLKQRSATPYRRGESDLLGDIETPNGGGRRTKKRDDDDGWHSSVYGGHRRHDSLIDRYFPDLPGRKQKEADPDDDIIDPSAAMRGAINSAAKKEDNE